MEAHTHKYALLANTHPSMLSVPLRPPSLAPSLPSTWLLLHPSTSSFLKAAMSSTESPLKGVFHLHSTNADQGSFAVPITSPSSPLPLPSPPVLHRLSSSFSSRFFSENQTPLMNHAADICGKATTTLTWATATSPNVCLVTCHLPKRIHK